MRKLLARFGAGPGADHRAVFQRFAERLGQLLSRPHARARVRLLRG